jgi:predicted outer membrane protein
MSSSGPLRLLPWSGPEGQPCYLSTDGDSYVSRLADDMEAAQLSMGTELLRYAEKMINDHTASELELRYLTAKLSETLRDALRIAESRGARLSG